MTGPAADETIIAFMETFVSQKEWDDLEKEIFFEMVFNMLKDRKRARKK